jgi:hypothetical protein
MDGLACYHNLARLLALVELFTVSNQETRMDDVPHLFFGRGGCVHDIDYSVIKCFEALLFLCFPLSFWFRIVFKMLLSCQGKLKWHIHYFK